MGSIDEYRHKLVALIYVFGGNNPVFNTILYDNDKSTDDKVYIILEKTDTVITFADITAKFTDANFLEEVRKAINKPTGPIYNTDVAGVTELHIENKGIINIAGIEYFTNLTYFNCSNNSLTAIDISKNKKLRTLWCSNNQLTEIDLSKNFYLSVLDCSNNRLTSIDVSNASLTNLICSNNQLDYIDVSKNTHLTNLICSNNKLTSIDVSKNLALFGNKTREMLGMQITITPPYLDCSNNLMPSESSVKGFKGKWDGEKFIFHPQRK